MLTALAVLFLSAIGGGIIGAVLTDSYPKDVTCTDCGYSVVKESHENLEAHSEEFDQNPIQTQNSDTSSESDDSKDLSEIASGENK
jgi:16S rRNA G1207 methylase RsmC